MNKFTKEELALLESKGVTFEVSPSLGMDADLSTIGSLSVLAQHINYIDPQVINVVFAPTSATRIAKEVQKGTFVDKQASFQVVENAGSISAYGDYSNSGGTSTNNNWVFRQALRVQTWIQVGDEEAAIASRERVNVLEQKHIGSNDILNRFLNASYFFGVEGLLNYGMINDPSLPPAIAPSTKTSGGQEWKENTPPVEIFGDVQTMFNRLMRQLDGNLRTDDSMTLALPSFKVGILANANEVMGMNAMTLIKNTFPNMQIEYAPEYETEAGNIIQLRKNVESGIETVELAYNDKVRSHRVEQYSSFIRMKKSAGTWGAINKYPVAIVTMIGV